MSKILVIGVDHFLQNVESVCMTPTGKDWEAKQKAALRARLEELISKCNPQLIAEELNLTGTAWANKSQIRTAVNITISRCHGKTDLRLALRSAMTRDPKLGTWPTQFSRDLCLSEFKRAEEVPT
jgi:hypothetical protein